MPNVTQTPVAQPWLFKGPIAGSINQFDAFQQGAPDILSLYQNVPQLQVPGLDPTQTGLLSNLISTAQNNPEQQQQLALLQQLSGGPIGSSPVTQQAMQAYRELSAPLIEQQAALRGTAGGGQAIEALGQGQTEALVPLLEQEAQNKAQAVGQYGQVGQQNMQNIGLALEAAGLPREVALQQQEAINQAQQQGWQTALGLQTAPMSLWGPAGIGGRSSTSMTGMDWISGIGKGLSPSGIFGGGA